MQVTVAPNSYQVQTQTSSLTPNAIPAQAKPSDPSLQSAQQSQKVLQGLTGKQCQGEQLPDWCGNQKATTAKATPQERLARGQQLLAHPDQIQNAEDADAVAAALRANRRPDGRPVGGPITFNDHIAAVRSLEVLAPNLPASEIATHLRQRFYPDHPGFMLPTRANQQPLPPAADRFLSSFHSGDQDVRLGQGVTADISHALVGFDALSNGMPIRARVYTYGGDLIQGAVSAVGLNPSGDLNNSDWRGNGWGFQMGDAYRANPNARLSDLLTSTAPKK